MYIYMYIYIHTCKYMVETYAVNFWAVDHRSFTVFSIQTYPNDVGP